MARPVDEEDPRYAPFQNMPGAPRTQQPLKFKKVHRLRRRMNNELNFPPNFAREVRSRLYRRRFLQVNTRWKALGEIYLRPCVVKMNQRKNGIYKIYKLLHRSAFKNSAKFRQTFSHFYNFIFEISLIFRKICPYLTNLDEKFPEFQQIWWKISKSPRFSNFLRFRTENY